VFGWANVAADLWKVTGLVVVTSLWRARRTAVAITLTALWVMCLLWGVIGAIGVYAQDRTAFVGGRAATVASYQDAEQEVQKVDARLAGLTKRTAAQVEGAINAVLAQPVLVDERVRGTVQKVSEGCTKQLRITAEQCLEVARLREELAGATEAQRLEQRRTQLRAEIARLREKGGTVMADPVAELFSWLSRGQLSVRDVSFGFPLAFALLVEMVSALGLAGIVTYAEATRPVRAGHGEIEPDTASHAPTQLATSTVGSVLDWVVDRGIPTNDARGISGEELHQDYAQWCALMKASSLDLDRFNFEFDRVRQMPEVGGKIRKFSNRYYGIRLADKVAMLAARR
jgi:hypothetical protein